VEGEIFGLSGNLSEWIAPCIETQAGLSCPVRSRYAFVTNQGLVQDGELADGTCEGVEALVPDTTEYGLGIRCCADPDVP
jgi:hypothetical protein